MTQQMEQLKQASQYIEWPTNRQWQQWQQHLAQQQANKEKQNG